MLDCKNFKPKEISRKNSASFMSMSKLYKHVFVYLHTSSNANNLSLKLLFAEMFYGI